MAELPPFSPFERAIADLLRDIPVKWNPIDWDDLSEAQTRALNRLVHAALAEAKGYLRTQAEGTKEYIEVITVSRGFCAREEQAQYTRLMRMHGFIDVNGHATANIFHEKSWTHVRLTSLGEEQRDYLLNGSITEDQFQYICFGNAAPCQFHVEYIFKKNGRLPILNAKKGGAETETTKANEEMRPPELGAAADMMEENQAQKASVETPQAIVVPAGDLSLPEIWAKYAVENEAARSRIRVNLNNALRGRPGLQENQRRTAGGEWERVYPAQLVDEIVAKDGEKHAK
jgi:hypothetical protein